ncbi:MAG: hypothetical protein AAGL66_12470, partial [Pseudomonadota bacterium]
SCALRFFPVSLKLQAVRGDLSGHECRWRVEAVQRFGAVIALIKTKERDESRETSCHQARTDALPDGWGAAFGGAKVS